MYHGHQGFQREMTEIGEMLDIAVRTVERDWKFSRVWLADRLEA